MTESTDPGHLDVPLQLKDRALAAAAEGITIADALRPDRPLIYANEGFEILTGYPVEYALGKNCRFLQGPDTDPKAIQEIREALAENRPCTVEILNYRRNGEPFWNRLSITPVRDPEGRVTHFIGVQSDITDRVRAQQTLLQTTRELEAANREMQANLEAAARIQRSFLPSSLRPVDGARFAWRLEACEELAGDTLGIIPIDDENVALYVLDVSGHGVSASLMSVTLSRWINRRVRPQAPVEPPVELVGSLNHDFPIDLDTAQYFTILYGVLHLPDRRFRYVAAGHPGPVHLHAGSARTITSPGFPVGVVAEPDYTEDILELEPGDRLVLLSDGVLEARSAAGAHFGSDRLEMALAGRFKNGLEDMVDATVADLQEWSARSRFQDDVSFLAAEVR